MLRNSLIEKEQEISGKRTISKTTIRNFSDYAPMLVLLLKT